ncbi:MAG: trypsin-like serine protease [Clostridiales bacterium]|nr:trypsin-like serine protease [Clostridiales bacterium]
MNNNLYDQNNVNDNGYNNPSPYTIYPTPKLKDNKKGRKKIAKSIQFIASAIIFGIIAGAAFQGYNYLSRPNNEVNIDVKEDKHQYDMDDVSSVDDNQVLPINSTNGAIVTDVSEVVANVMPSIVAIKSTSTVTTYDFFGRKLNRSAQGNGSGFIIGQNGSDLYIVTNNHVIEDVDYVEVVFADDATAEATVKNADPKTDLAVLIVNANKLSEETLSSIKVASLGDSDNIKVGEMAIAIGNALGYGQSITVGYISALDREITVDGIKMTLLQTDAAINPGNSGGALINIAGEVIGINTVKYAAEEVEGMGYAIPISSAIPMINELINRELLNESERGFLGINLTTARNVTEVFSQSFNMPVGIFVNDVVEDSPAEKAGLKQGNIIVGFNDMKVETIEDLLNILTYSRAGEEITLVVKVLENGEYIEKELKVTLSHRP